MSQQKIVINNAISAYFGLAGLILFLPTQKEGLRHPFVRSHAKTALVIHCLFLLTYVIFIWFRLGGDLGFFGFYLNFIIASLLCLGLFAWMLFGVYKATRGETFSVGEIVNLTRVDALYEVKESKLNEQGIVTIMLTLVPFVGMLIAGKYEKYKSPIIENNLKFNLVSTFLILSLFVTNYGNIATLLGLTYIVGGVFFSILLIANKNLIVLRLEFLPTMKDCSLYAQTLFRYLVKYFKKNSFTPLRQMYASIQIEDQTNQGLHQEILTNLPKPKFSHKIAYLPLINLICLMELKSGYKFHIFNGIGITLVGIFIFSSPLGYGFLLFLLFPLFAGLGHRHTLHYQIPFIFSIGQFFIYILKKIFFFGGKVKEKHLQNNEITLK